MVAQLHLPLDDSDTANLAYLLPQARLLADEALNGEARQSAETRLTQWLRAKFASDLAPLFALHDAKDPDGLARGLAFQLVEHKGNIARPDISDLLGRLDQPMRGQLRKLGVRFGAYNVFLPALLKPAPARLLALIALIEEQKGDRQNEALQSLLHALPGPGLTSVPRQDLPPRIYRAAGFYTTESRAIRLDMLERLADLIRPLLEADKARQGFQANEQMMSIMGCGAADLSEILTALGYQSHEVTPAPEAELVAEAAPDSDATDDKPAIAQIFWRPKPPRRAHKAKGKKPAQAGGKKPGNQNKAATQPPKRQKKADPNSPFAILQSLSLGATDNKKSDG